ncbi:hypothetical protein AV656_11050 [Bhargavaea cecembensis]|uniref:Uncharacterized protein n=1 Tax=Bhargavaea cecembensis TaxID=394098 RepID=A0A165GTA1_9BACL|nr:hypothetical protein [Bhargavaea cecembensis]KZE37589.1 hypothetical protein AV656_11050 [Bhargavaea cecembensis]
MIAKQIQRDIEEINYWDARVLRMDSCFFGDEVAIVFEDTDENIKVLFTGCSVFSFKTHVNDRLKPLKELVKSQIPYFIQDIEIEDIQVEGKSLLKCKIQMPPLDVELVCSNIILERISKDEAPDIHSNYF